MEKRLANSFALSSERPATATTYIQGRESCEAAQRRIQVTWCSSRGKVLRATQKSCEIFPAPQIPHLSGLSPSMSAMVTKLRLTTRGFPNKATLITLSRDIVSGNDECTQNKSCRTELCLG